MNNQLLTLQTDLGRVALFFTELASLGQFSHRVTMSVCVCVCLSVFAMGNLKTWKDGKLETQKLGNLVTRKVRNSETQKHGTPPPHFCAFWYWCCYPHCSRYSVSPICQILKNYFAHDCIGLKQKTK